MPRFFSAVCWALLALLTSFSMVRAADPSVYDLRTAEFKIPADWTITYSRRDQEYDFASPDGRYELWARWWFPDEPLLGFDDIVRHETRVLAGQEALFRQLEQSGGRSLELAFLKKDAEGEIFLWQLHSQGTSLAEDEAMFDALLAGLTLDGLPVVAAAQPAAAAAKPQSQAEMFRDPDGAFALPFPAGWTAQTTASASLHQAVLASATRDALILVATATPDRGMTAAQVLDAYMGVLYRDSLVVKSIEDERYPTIAGTEVHAIETIAKVYAINGIAMTYPRGRVWIYQSSDDSGGQTPFLIITIRPEGASQALSDMLETMAAGFTLDASPALGTLTQTVTPSDNAQSPVQTQTPPTAQPAYQLGVGGLLFDGKTLSGLLPFAFNSVTFAENAKLTGNEISFAFPNDRGWAKLGLATPTAVIEMPARDSATTPRITAIIDADKSTGISFALSPPADAAKDPDTVDDLKLQLSTMGDGIGAFEVTTRDPKQTVRASFPWPKGETVLHVLLRPDHVIDVRDGSGTQLAQAALEADFAGRAWALQTFVQVHRKNRAASLVLKRLSFDIIPFDPVPKVDAIAEGPRSDVIFDGRAFGAMWTPVSRREGEVAKYLRLSDGALRVAWTAEDKGSWTGIATPEAALWLDRFTGAAEARIDLALDGAGSKDFEIALQSAYALPGNLSGNTSYVLRFAEQDDGTYSVLSSLRSKEKEGLSAAGLLGIPDRVSLVLTPKGVRVEGEGMPEGVLAFADIQDGAGLRIAIHARNSTSGGAALVLRGVRVSLQPGEPGSPPEPAQGVEPLPMTVFFDGQVSENWKGHSVGKALFEALTVQHSDGLTLKRRDPVPDWSRIALIGSEVVANLDYRVDTTPYEVVVNLSPAAGLGTRIFLHRSAARFEEAAESVVTLRALTTGPEVGGLEVLLHTGHFSYDRWRRVLPAAQWRDGWNGTVRLRLGPKWIALGLGDNWLMRGPRQTMEMMMAVTPGGAAKTDGGDVTLQSITGGWITPEGMSEAERWRLVDADAFDPDAFADLMADELVED
jgi:hypothetical protein